MLRERSSSSRCDPQDDLADAKQALFPWRLRAVGEMAIAVTAWSAESPAVQGTLAIQIKLSRRRLDDDDIDVDVLGSPSEVRSVLGDA